MALFDEFFDEEFFEDDERDANCRYCGESPLYWQEDENGWRLYNEEGTRHVCEPDAEGF